jgi:hypothetical protein
LKHRLIRIVLDRHVHEHVSQIDICRDREIVETARAQRWSGR